MNMTQVHLVLNHVPVLGTIIALALLAWGLARRSEEVQRASLGLFVISALVAAAVFLTGEPAEDRIEKIAGISKAVIERHEDAATIALWAVSALGAGSLLTLLALRVRPAWGRKLLAVTVALALAAGALLGWAAHLGGNIRHPEIGFAGGGVIHVEHD